MKDDEDPIAISTGLGVVYAVRALAYPFVPYFVFFVSFLMFTRWWTALIEFGVLGVLAWKLADRYDRHHEAHKFDTGLHLMSRATAIDKYLETYGIASEEE